MAAGAIFGPGENREPSCSRNDTRRCGIARRIVWGGPGLQGILMKATAPAALLVIAGLSMSAQAAEPTGTLTLACEGKVWVEDKRLNRVCVTGGCGDPVSMGVIVDFVARTVDLGHDALPKFPIRISDITETTISFGGDNHKVWDQSLNGTIDRVTGTLEAIFVQSDPKLSASYSLKCRPTQRMF
jgi:hypothetical protein